MPEEDSSSNTLEARSSAPEASAGSPATVPNVVRTLQDVERDIQKESMELDEARKKCKDAASARKAARSAEELAEAKESVDLSRFFMEFGLKRLEMLNAELARLQAAATASSSEQKSGLLGRTRPREDATDYFRPTPKPYIPDCSLEPDSSDQIPLNLKREIEPIPCGADDSVPPACTEEQKAVIQWNRAAYNASLSEAIVGFLKNKIPGPLSADNSFYHRNNYFFDIIRIIAAAGTTHPALEMTRDHKDRSSRTGPDVTICRPYYPDLVVAAEKAVGEVGAENEICDKFVFLPHYSDLTRIVGIAIIGNQFKIGYIHRDPKRFEVLMSLTAGEDGNGYTLVQAAVNIGIWFKATMSLGVLHPLLFRFGEPSVTANRALAIYRDKFRKILYQRDDINLGALCEFYKAVRSDKIPYFEYPVNDEGKTDSVVLTGIALDLVLKPVGLTREPWTSEELKDCLVCILTALQDLHGRGYVHLDLRWPNIIHVDRREWYIIDGEYVRKAGDPYPKNLHIRDGDVVDSAVDLTLLGKMLGDLEVRRLLTPNIKALIEYLTKGDRSKRSAEDALQLVQGWVQESPSSLR